MQRKRVMALAALLLFVGSCSGVFAKPAVRVPSDAQLVERSLAVLRKGVREGKAFVRVHAAEALIWNGYPQGLYDSFIADEPTAKPGYRIGVWRVLVQLEWENAAIRDGYVQKVREVYFDPKSTDRTIALETLGKIKDTGPKEQFLRDCGSSNLPIKAIARWVAANSGDAHYESLLSDLLLTKNKGGISTAAYALKFFRQIRPRSLAALRKAYREMPEHGGEYVVSAVYVHSRGKARVDAQKALWKYLKTGNTGQKFEAALGLSYGMDRANIVHLLPVMQSDKDLDARIGAAQAIIRTINKPSGWGYKDDLRVTW